MLIYIYYMHFFPNKNTQNGWYSVFPDISSWVFLRYHIFMQSCVLQKSNVQFETQPAKGWLEPFQIIDATNTIRCPRQGSLVTRKIGAKFGFLHGFQWYFCNCSQRCKYAPSVEYNP